jgi:hypothetical protein
MQTVPPLFQKWNSGQLEDGRKAWQCSTRTIASGAMITLHTVRTCKEQGIDLPIQAVGNTVTTVWPALMRDLESEARSRALEDYKGLADDPARLKAELKSSQSALATECSRVKRRDDTICDLKEEIEALKRRQSTVSATTSSVWSIAHCWALITPNGLPTSTSSIGACGPDITSGASIPYRCTPWGRSSQRSTRQLRQ